jgi:hypothetical protein
MPRDGLRQLLQALAAEQLPANGLRSEKHQQDGRRQEEVTWKILLDARPGR